MTRPNPFGDYAEFKVDNALTAAGSTKDDALVLKARLNRLTTVSAGNGVKLYAVPEYDFIWVRNDGSATVNVYPPAGKKINAGTADAAVTIAAGGVSIFVSDGAGNFFRF